MKRRIMFQLLITAYIFEVSMASGQVCDGTIGVDSNVQNSYRDQAVIPENYQAIVTSYQFHCCGSIREWRAEIYSDDIDQNNDNNDDDNHYDDSDDDQELTIQFQVWRPSPTLEGDVGCYSLVGENILTSVILQSRRELIRETPLPAQRIAVQPGDVVGFRLETSADTGVVLDKSRRTERVWYGDIDEDTTEHSNCHYHIGSDGTISSSTNLGPIVLASLASTNCPTWITPTTSTSQATSTTNTQHSSLTNPTPTTDPTITVDTTNRVSTTLTTTTTEQDFTELITSNGNSALTITDDNSAPTEQDSNQLAVGNSAQGLVTVASTASSTINPPPTTSTHYYVTIIIATVVCTLVLLSILSAIIVLSMCWKIKQKVKGHNDKVDCQEPPTVFPHPDICSLNTETHSNNTEGVFLNPTYDVVGGLDSRERIFINTIYGERGDLDTTETLRSVVNNIYGDIEL